MQFIILFFIYLIPSIIAGYKQHKDGYAIMALNILIGWTFIGWVIALIWALKSND